MIRVVWIIGLMLAIPCSAWGEDEVEFLSGAKVKGTVKEIRKDKNEFDFEVQLGGRSMLRTYPYAKVHTVTIKGKTFVLTKPSATGTSTAGAVNATRSNAEVLRLIEAAGQSPPDWFDATPLDYPQSLDLSWPIKAPDAGWNNQVNVGQYMWDIINPNPNRWKSGIRLMHHLLSVHENDQARMKRNMATLGGMYFRLLQDYPRAAYWLRKARLSQTDGQRTMLAECYWRMGSKKMANEILSAKRLPLSAIKLLGDMGQTDRALRLADAFGSRKNSQDAYLLAGDACRQAGRYSKAIAYYEKVIDAPDARNEDYAKRHRGRAADSIEAIRLFDQADVRNVADGTYKDISIGFAGDIEVEVAVAAGRIQDVRVTRHNEKQFYAAINDTTQQIIQKQSVKNIDATSRATITSQAIVNATAKALASGAR